MSGEHCKRWGEISEREMFNEPLSREDRTFAEEHLATCSLCRAEATLLKGVESLPGKWTDPLNNVLESYVPGYNRMKISDLAEGIYGLIT